MPVEIEFAPHPGGSYDVSLSTAQVEGFRRDGFTHVDRITTDEELDWLGVVYDAFFDSRSGAFEGGYFDLARPYDAEGQDVLPQVLNPERLLPQLRDTICYRNANRLAAQLLGADLRALTGWGHMIRKPPLVGHETPWHQDEAYWDVDYDFCAVGVWMPLDVATVESGCMQFIPGSHQGEVLPHRHIGDDPAVHGLYATDGVERARAVAVPLKPGGATMHHPRMLHYTAPNTTPNQRRAYANEFQLPPTRRAEPAHRPWIAEGQRERARRGLASS